MLLVAVFSGDPWAIHKAIRDVEYHIKRNYQAYLSHRKKKCKESCLAAQCSWFQ
jgi:hypothetical protein